MVAAAELRRVIELILLAHAVMITVALVFWSAFHGERHRP